MTASEESCTGYPPPPGVQLGKPIIPVAPVLFCLDCGMELDEHDVTANLNVWGVFKGYCSDDIENHVED